LYSASISKTPENGLAGEQHNTKIPCTRHKCRWGILYIENSTCAIVIVFVSGTNMQNITLSHIKTHANFGCLLYTDISIIYCKWETLEVIATRKFL